LDWLGPGAFFLLLLLPVGVWLWLRSARWWGMHPRGERLIFPTSIGLQVAGVFAAYPMICLFVWSLKQPNRPEPGAFIIMLLFAMAGFSVLFRSIEIDGEGLSKKFLWKTQKISWSEANDLTRFRNGTYGVSGDARHLRFDRRYADFELLILEICRRLDAKHTKEATATEPNASSKMED
jgi:hypothetical protein